MPTEETLSGTGVRRAPIVIKATIDLDQSLVHLTPTLAEFEQGTIVSWEFINIPPSFVPAIEAVSFEPGPTPTNGEGRGVFFRLFKRMERTGTRLTGTPYRHAVGTCWYEVVMVPKPNTPYKEIRLDCAKSDMGGIRISPPPPGGEDSKDEDKSGIKVTPPPPDPPIMSSDEHPTGSAIG